MTPRTVLPLAVSLGLLVTYAASTFECATAAPTARDASLTIDTVATGMRGPTQITFIGPDDFLVGENTTGHIYRVTAGAVTGPVLDVAVNTYRDHGFYSVAVHPDFSSNGWVYVYFTESNTSVDTGAESEFIANRIYRYSWNGTALVDPLLIWSYPSDPGVFHSGGVFAFGPDDKLYHVYGDNQRNGQNQNLAGGAGPDNTGVLLRLNDDGSIPGDNPFAGQAGLERVYAYGIRNSFGLDFDPITGTLWQTENGPENYDEINLVAPGFNSGWVRIMGPAARDAQGTADLVAYPGSAYSDPEFSFLQAQGITAIEFLRSAELGAEYENDVFTADIVYGRIFHFELNPARDGLLLADPGLTDLVADSPEEENPLVFAEGFAGVTDLATGPDGTLYVVEYFPGSIFRIRAKTLDVVTGDSQLQVSCDPFGEVTVSGSYQVYGLAKNLPLSSVTTEFYLDSAAPQNLLASFTENALDNDADVSHGFTFSWPDSVTHDIVMVVDALDAAAEEFEDNNVARVAEECFDYVVAAPPLPVVTFGITGVFPNPFNPRTTIEYVVPRPGAVTIEVYDLKGRRVRTLLEGAVEAGENRLIWDGSDGRGRTVAAGTYVVRIEGEMGIRSRSITLLK